MCRGLNVSVAAKRALTALQPEVGGPLGVLPLRVVMRDELRLVRHHFTELLLDDFGDAPVVGRAVASQQRLVSGILDERVLEDVALARPAADREDELGLRQAREAGDERLRSAHPHGPQDVAPELAAQHRRQLRDGFGVAEMVEAGEQRIVEALRNHDLRHRGRGRRLSRLDDRLDELLDVQRHAVGLLDHLPQDIGREIVIGTPQPDQLRGILAAQAGQRHPPDVGLRRQRAIELRTMGQQHEDAGLAHPLDEEVHEIER